jgi:hypothetical protein
MFTRAILCHYSLIYTFLTSRALPVAPMEAYSTHKFLHRSPCPKGQAMSAREPRHCPDILFGELYRLDLIPRWEDRTPFHLRRVL